MRWKTRSGDCGGLNTLYGYDRKEFTGTKFAIGNIELGFKPIKEEVLLWLFHDLGRIAEGKEKLSDAEILHSAGIGVSLADYIRFYTARRFDCADPNFLFGVKLNLSL